MFKLVVSSLFTASLAFSADAEPAQDLNTVLRNAKKSNGPVHGQEDSSTQQVQKLGFKKMDVVHTVNGAQVDNPQKAMELYNQMKADDIAVVERREPASGRETVVKDWNMLLSKATLQEKNDLGKVLQQIRMIPAKDPSTGKSVFKVIAVEKGSVFEREGVRTGDLISSGG